MSKIAVVYWSGTGNTEIMALAVAEGAKEKGGEVSIFTATEFNSHMIDDFDSIAFGCPSMGSEVLEEDEFQPMFSSCEARLDGKKIGLFGSYDWGDGEWMHTWEETCKDAGAILVSQGVICNLEPDSAGKAECSALGASLA